MARYKRTTKKKHQLPDGIYNLLAKGVHDPKDDWGEVGGLDKIRLSRPKSRPAMYFSRAWEQFEDQVMERWFLEGNHGRRPFAWWKVNQHIRERISGTGDDVSVIGHYNTPEFGVPTKWLMSYHRKMIEDEEDLEFFDQYDPPIFESEASFLERNDLLTSFEKRKLNANAFEPESALFYI